jgi:DNA-binding CsgD family transcriptional regulator
VCEALLATGSANEVAERLHITANTARSHLKSIFEKVGVANQAQLMQRLTLLGRPSTPSDIVGVGIATGP